MKRKLSTFFIICALLNINCMLFTSYQSAKMLLKGDENVLPSAAGSFYSNGLGVTPYWPIGLQIGIGLSERINLILSEGLYFGTKKDDEGVKSGFIFNHGGVETKIGLVKDKLALSFPIAYHVGNGKYNLSMQIGTKLIKTFYLNNGFDITVTPHWGFILSGYPSQYAGAFFSLGIPAGTKAVIRPEIGVANIDWTSEWNANIGIGIVLPIKKSR